MSGEHPSGAGGPAPEAAVASGHDALPHKERDDLSRAIRLAWISLGSTAVAVALVASFAGQSQAMKAAWIEDSLAFLPPIAFLVATRRIRRPADAEHPYGRHRSIGIAHLVAAVALLTMGVFLVVDSSTALIAVERPSVGMTVLLGHGIWSGWLMIAVLAVTCIPPIILARRKLRLAEPLHDKVLYADAEMNRADWTSAAASIVGILGIGLGLWWADAAAALLISVSILRDGGTNLRNAVRGLADGRARTVDDAAPHPLIAESARAARRSWWVADAFPRVRDEGHVFHVEMFVVPTAGHRVSAQECEELRAELQDLDWKIHDVVIAPVAEIPSQQAFRV